MLKSFGQFFNRINQLMLYCAAGLFACAWLLTCYEVLVRYFLHSPTNWTVGITEYILLYITFLAIPWLQGKDQHIKVDILVARLGRRARALVDMFILGISAMLFLVVTWFGLVTTRTLALSGALPFQETLGIPKAALIAVIPVCTFFLVVQLVRQLIGKYREWRNPSAEILPEQESDGAF